MIAVFGAFGDPAHDLGELLSLLGRRQFVVWMVMTFLVVVITIALARFLKYLSAPSRHHQNGKLEHLPSQRRTSSTSTHRHKSRVRTLSIPVPQSIQNVTPRAFRLRMLRGLSYGLISGILSAHSLLVAKSAVELIVRTIVDRSNQFNRYQSWLILLALVFLALSQLYYLHSGLRLCSTSVLYPFVFCIYNIIAILDGLIYFRQTNRLGPLHAGLIALGTVILLSGVVALSWRLDDTSPTDTATIAPPQTPAPITPLTPSLGFMPRNSASSLSHDDSDEDDFPIAQASKRRRRARTMETTPLLSARQNVYDARRRSIHDSASSSKRRSQITLLAPTTTPAPSSRSQIWRELEDEEPESDDDYLASLPRVGSPWLHRDDHHDRPGSRKSYGSLGSKSGGGSGLHERRGYGGERSAKSRDREQQSSSGRRMQKDEDADANGSANGNANANGGSAIGHGFITASAAGGGGEDQRRSSAPNLVGGSGPRSKKHGRVGRKAKARAKEKAKANGTVGRAELEPGPEREHERERIIDLNDIEDGSRRPSRDGGEEGGGGTAENNRIQDPNPNSSSSSSSSSSAAAALITRSLASFTQLWRGRRPGEQRDEERDAQGG